MGVFYWECYLSCVSLCLFMLCYGTAFTYPSPAFPDINSGHFRFRLSPDMMSWLASFSSLFAIPGSFLMVPIMDRLGRKLAIVMATVPLAISWLLIVCSSSVLPFAIGRALGGVALGMGNTCISVYVSELSPKQIRGKLSMLVYMHFNIGGFLVNLVAVKLNWQWLALACLAAVALTSLTTITLHESPRWLVSRGQREAAAMVIERVWKLSQPKRVAEELDALSACSNQRSSLTFCHSMLELCKPPLRKALLLTQALFMFQMLTGVAYVTTYTISIFEEAGTDSSNSFLQVPNYQSCLVFLGNILGNLSSLFLLDRFGRKKLLIVSSLVIVVSLSGVGAFYYVLSVDQPLAASYLRWLPLTCLLTFMFSLSSCFIVVPQLLMTELFGNEVRAAASALGSVTHNLTVFVVVKAFPHLSALAPYGVFWLFALFTLLSVLLVALKMPETKGMSLEHIHHMWNTPKGITKPNLPVETSRL